MKIQTQTSFIWTSKGFTIIELLVVIAVIAVLSGIVLANVGQYGNRGKDSAMQGNLATIFTSSVVFYDTNGTYTNFCASGIATTALAAADRAFDGNATPNQVTDCLESAGAFAACGQLKVTDSYFCVDSTGTKKTVAGRSGCVSTWNLTACP